MGLPSVGNPYLAVIIAAMYVAATYGSNLLAGHGDQFRGDGSRTRTDTEDGDDDDDHDWLHLPRQGNVMQKILSEYSLTYPGPADYLGGFQHPTEPSISVSAPCGTSVFSRWIYPQDGTWRHGRFYVYSAFVGLNDGLSIHEIDTYMWRIKGSFSISDTNFDDGGQLHFWLLRTMDTYDRYRIGDVLSLGGHVEPEYSDRVQCLGQQSFYFRPPVSTTYQKEIQIQPLDMLATYRDTFNFLTVDEFGDREVLTGPTDGSRLYFVFYCTHNSPHDSTPECEFTGSLYSYLWYTKRPWDATDP